MKRILRATEDGSHTIFNLDLDEPYHSTNGAIQESTHIFIEKGFNSCEKKYIRILELGFGTGLNMLLTFKHAGIQNKNVYYHAVEKFPLVSEEYSLLNYCQFLGQSLHQIFIKAHEADWNTNINLSENFILFKELADFRDMKHGPGFDIVYFDAFAPSKQPELWENAIIEATYKSLAPQGIWISYTAKGSVKRALQAAGFETEKFPGPPGKREILRGRKA